MIIAVIGDPEKTGTHKFLEGTETVYQHGCAAAIQNTLLVAHALDLGRFWFTLFDRSIMKQTLGIDPSKEPSALICIGKAAGSPLQTPRKGACGNVMCGLAPFCHKAVNGGNNGRCRPKYTSTVFCTTSTQ